jgi:hydroxymethylglutaryl-CoA lyase|tara:strand:+ start:285 stop:1205 length:921 start_codon:yes stop_codon:yes gene_type:complete
VVEQHPQRPTRVRLIEVGPRDGLQNETHPVPLTAKHQLLEDLADAGLDYLEAGSFVHPQRVPQMADSDALFQAMNRRPGVTYAALTPNMKGLERALAVGADEVALFAAASETFSQKNINCSIAESLGRFAPVIAAATNAGLPVRGYISCVLGCPYEGAVTPGAVLTLTRELLAMGCREVSLGDTIGVGTAGDTERLLAHLLPEVGPERLAVHFHDTYGQALANILVALNAGIATIDSAVAGLGGCPFAPGAAGNVATEDVVYLLNGLGIEHGVDLDKLILAGERICSVLERDNASRAARAYRNRRT